jgi:hypothetical protein
LRFMLASALCAAASCNLVNSDLTKTQIQLPVQMYQVDTSDHENVRLPASIPTVPCSSNDVCCPGGCQGDGYTLACGPAGTCQATITAVLVSSVDLSTNPSLAKAMSLADVTLKSIQYGVCMNTLSVSIPSIELWLAPAAVTKPDATMGAVKIGTIPMVAPGTDPGCPPDTANIDTTKLALVQLEPTAQQTFKTFASNPKQKFNAIAVGTFVERAGDPTPTGALTVYVSGIAEVSF